MAKDDSWETVEIPNNEEDQVEYEVEEKVVEAAQPEVEVKEEEVQAKEEPQELEGIETSGAQKRIRQLVKQRKEREDGNGGGGTGTDTGKDKSTGLSAADFEDYEGIGGAGSHAAAEAAAAAAAGDAAAAEEASDRSQKGMDDYEDVEGTGFGGGYAGDGSFDIGLGYNELSDLGYAEEVDRGIQARDQQVADNMVEDASALGLDLNVTVDKDGNYTYSGADAFSAALGAAGDFYSQFSPASIAIDAGRGFYDMVTGLPGVVADIGTDLRNEVADRFGVSPSEVTQEQVNAVTSGVGPDAGIGEFRDVSPTQTAVAMGVSPQQAIDTAQIDFTNLERAVDNSGMYSGFGDMPGYSSPTESALSSDFTAMQNQADLNAITSAYEEAERARTGTQLDRDISAYEEAENAMFGGGYAGTGITPDIASSGDIPQAAAYRLGLNGAYPV